MSQLIESPSSEIVPVKFSTRFFAAILDLFIISILYYILIFGIALLFPNKLPFPFNVKEKTIETPFEVSKEGNTTITKSTVVKQKYDGDRLISECTMEKTTKKSGSISTSSWHKITPCKSSIWKLDGLFFLIFFVYGVYFEMAPRNATIGKKFMGIRLVKIDGTPLTSGQTILRNLLKLLFFGFIFVPFTAKKQALHDIFAKSIVVQSMPKNAIE